MVGPRAATGPEDGPNSRADIAAMALSVAGEPRDFSSRPAVRRERNFSRGVSGRFAMSEPSSRRATRWSGWLSLSAAGLKPETFGMAGYSDGPVESFAAKPLASRAT